MPPGLISVKEDDINNLTVRLNAIGQQAPLAMQRALNRARVSVQARLIKWLVTATGIQSRRIRKSMRSRDATRQQLFATISLYGGRARLIDYARAIQSANLPASGFRAKMPGSGHVGFFERAPGSRHRRVGQPFAPHELPIREILGPPFTRFIGDIGLADLLKYGGERLKIELERELNFREQSDANAA
jgi:hypothetical protein